MSWPFPPPPPLPPPLPPPFPPPLPPPLPPLPPPFPPPLPPLPPPFPPPLPAAVAPAVPAAVAPAVPAAVARSLLTRRGLDRAAQSVDLVQGVVRRRLRRAGQPAPEPSKEDRVGGEDLAEAGLVRARGVHVCPCVTELCPVGGDGIGRRAGIAGQARLLGLRQAPVEPADLRLPAGGRARGRKRQRLNGEPQAVRAVDRVCCLRRDPRSRPRGRR